MSPAKRFSVVVIGASHAGLGLSHKLLRLAPNVAITLISPSDEYFFNIAAPRFLVKPDALPTSRYLYNIHETFSGYPSGAFAFVKGLATSIDPSDKSVAVRTGAIDSTKLEMTTVPFDYLVIASGSTTPATLGLGSLKLPLKVTAFEDTRKAISEAQKKLQAANHIVIGGAGPLGVELAGELAEASGSNKTITLVSRTDVVLPGATVKVQKEAESLLKLKGVQILKDVAVDRVEQRSGLISNDWTVTLSTGKTIAADEYISTTGVAPNNAFIPLEFLNDDGWVNVDEHLRVVQGAESRTDIFAIGDINHHPDRLLSRVSVQAATAAFNITASIENRSQRKAYSAEAQAKMMVVPVGQSTGVGHVGGWTLWGFLVWFFKGRDFLTYKAPKFLIGKE